MITDRPLGVTTVSFGHAAYLLALEGERWDREPRPYLKFTGASTADAVVLAVPHPTLGPAGATGPPMSKGSVARFTRLAVANDPPPGKRGARAEKATAHVRFIKDDGNVVLEFQARWAETLQRAQRPELNLSYETVQLDIDANGLDHPLDLTMKSPNGDVFAVNDDNSSALNFEYEPHRLSEPRYWIAVRLRGANTDGLDGVFLLENPNGGNLRLTKHDEERCPAPVVAVLKAAG